jgi:hypothetical protein
MREEEYIFACTDAVLFGSSHIRLTLTFLVFGRHDARWNPLDTELVGRVATESLAVETWRYCLVRLQ